MSNSLGTMPTAKRGTVWARRVEQLTQPSLRLSGGEDARQAQLLAALSLVLAAIMTLAALISFFTSIVFPDPTISLGIGGSFIILAAATGLWIAYVLSRTDRYILGAWVAIGVVFAFLTALMLLFPSHSTFLAMGYLMPVLSSTIFLRASATLRVFAIALITLTAMVILQRISFVTFGFVWGVSFATMLLTLLVSVLREEDLRQVRRLRELEAADGERLRRELELARKVQIAMLPRHLPDVPNLAVAAYSKPAQEASGDFYDVFLLSHERGKHAKVGIVVCDVAGKGMSSALVMSATRAALRAEAERAHSPAEVLGKVNTLLAETLPSGLFVTLFYGVYDPQERRLCYASAGHPHPLWVQANTISEVENYGMPLGLVPDSDYQNITVSLQAGDSVFIYTDGLVEALNPKREMFGFERAQRVVQAHANERLKPEAILASTLRDMERFVAGERQQDDVTIVVLQVEERS